MKVVTAEEMMRVEQEAYRKYGPDLAAHFMEQAGEEVAQRVEDLLLSLRPQGLAKKAWDIYLLCAKGNNSGDAYVCGRILLARGYRVSAWQLTPIGQASPLCQKNYQLFLQQGGRMAAEGEALDFSFKRPGLIVDGLLGTGFKGALPQEYQGVIGRANRSGLPIVAIDVPSGLAPSEALVLEQDWERQLIRAKRTVYLGMPKLGFFLGQGWDFVGELVEGNFGLAQEFVDEAQAAFTFVTPELVRPWLPAVRPLRHKYEAGTVFALAGSKGMVGAAALSCGGALRSGCGMVYLSCPEGLLGELGALTPEVVKVPFGEALYKAGAEGEACRREWVERSKRASSCLLGPGLSLQPGVGFLLERLVPSLTVPTVLDADALNHYAQKPFPLPPQVIMTPHLGECQRLLGSPHKLTITKDLLASCQEYVEERQVTLILKGGVTFIFQPGQTIAVCTLGNPGMATAGSGDVLTGILAGLLAQGLDPYQAALLGTVLHGLAGKYARQEKTDYGLIASDLIEFLPYGLRDLVDC